MRTTLLMIALLTPPLTMAEDTNDSDRGCCVWITKNRGAICAPANAAYCRSKANNSSIEYHFFKNTGCRNVSMCPRIEAKEKQPSQDNK